MMGPGLNYERWIMGDAGLEDRAMREMTKCCFAVQLILGIVVGCVNDLIDVFRRWHVFDLFSTGRNSMPLNFSIWLSLLIRNVR